MWFKLLATLFITFFLYKLRENTFWFIIKSFQDREKMYKVFNQIDIVFFIISCALATYFGISLIEVYGR